MAAPLYFFAKKQRADVIDEKSDRFRPDLLRACGLLETFGEDGADDARPSRAFVNELTKAGPGGSSGMIVTLLPGSGKDILRGGYYPDFQQWQLAQRGPDAELWIGLDREHPPQPEDLLRSNAELEGGEPRGLHRGHRLPLADGRLWDVPVIRRPPAIAALSPGASLTRLPMDIGWDADGRFCETIKPAYRALWEDTGALADIIFEADGRIRSKLEITVEKGLNWALRILGLNYRYGRHEQNLLRAVDKVNVWQVLGAAVDAPLVYELTAKKNDGDQAPDPVNTPPGETGGCPSTDPAAASCS